MIKVGFERLLKDKKIIRGMKNEMLNMINNNYFLRISETLEFSHSPHY